MSQQGATVKLFTILDASNVGVSKSFVFNKALRPKSNKVTSAEIKEDIDENSGTGGVRR